MAAPASRRERVEAQAPERDEPAKTVLLAETTRALRRVSRLHRLSRRLNLRRSPRWSKRDLNLS